MDELKNKILEILETHIDFEDETEVRDYMVNQIISLFHGSKDYPNDYLKEYGRTVHKGGGR